MSMCVIGDVSNPLLVKEEVVPARKLVWTSYEEEGGCVSMRRRTRYIRTQKKRQRGKREEDEMDRIYRKTDARREKEAGNDVIKHAH